MVNTADLILLIAPRGAALASLNLTTIGVLADSAVVLVPDPPAALLRDRAQLLDVVVVDTNEYTIDRLAVDAVHELRTGYRSQFLALSLRQPFDSGPSSGPARLQDLERGLAAHPDNAMAALVEAGAIVGRQTLDDVALHRLGELESHQNISRWRVRAIGDAHENEHTHSSPGRSYSTTLSENKEIDDGGNATRILTHQGQRFDRIDVPDLGAGRESTGPDGSPFQPPDKRNEPLAFVLCNLFGMCTVDNPKPWWVENPPQ